MAEVTSGRATLSHVNYIPASPEQKLAHKKRQREDRREQRVQDELGRREGVRLQQARNVKEEAEHLDVQEEADKRQRATLAAEQADLKAEQEALKAKLKADEADLEAQILNQEPKPPAKKAAAKGK